MVLVKATESSEAGVMPSEKLMADMGAFNSELVEAGIMVSGDGLKPSSKGVRVRFKGAERSVVDGPFIETSELVAGYWIWNVESLEQAIEWVKRCPNPMPEESEIEIRPYYELADFVEADSSGEFVAKEEKLREELEVQSVESNPYLFFGGNCEEALNFYETALGAKVGMLMRFSECPDPVPDGMLGDNWEQKVMHAEFSVGKAKFLASDGCDSGGTFDGFRLSLQVETEAVAKRMFAALSEGGKVDMPLGNTFWSPCFGMVTDKFGLGWMVGLPPAQV